MTCCMSSHHVLMSTPSNISWFTSSLLLSYPFILFIFSFIVNSRDWHIWYIFLFILSFSNNSLDLRISIKSPSPLVACQVKREEEFFEFCLSLLIVDCPSYYFIPSFFSFHLLTLVHLTPLFFTLSFHHCRDEQWTHWSETPIGQHR